MEEHFRTKHPGLRVSSVVVHIFERFGMHLLEESKAEVKRSVFGQSADESQKQRENVEWFLVTHLLRKGENFTPPGAPAIFTLQCAMEQHIICELRA